MVRYGSQVYGPIAKCSKCNAEYNYIAGNCWLCSFKRDNEQARRLVQKFKTEKKEKQGYALEQSPGVGEGSF